MLSYSILNSEFYSEFWILDSVAPGGHASGPTQGVALDFRITPLRCRGGRACEAYAKHIATAHRGRPGCARQPAP
jgi:hypothetical protein